MKRLSVGIIGCGAIGTALAKAIKSGKAGSARLAAVYDVDRRAAGELSKLVGARKARGLEELIAKSNVVVECASQQAVGELGPKVAGKRDFVVLSVGALLDSKLKSVLLRKAKRGGTRIYAPSGAVCGLDGLKGARVGRIRKVVLTTTKPPASLGLACKRRKVLFRGSAKEAVRKFPKNVNVSAAISLCAGREIGVSLVVDPAVRRNTHELLVEGEFGRFTCRTENLPSKNPKTSALAAMSAIALIRNLSQEISVGT